MKRRLLGLVPVLIFIRVLGAVTRLVLVTFSCFSKVKYSKITESGWEQKCYSPGMLTGDANIKNKRIKTNK